jgi:hypothetical protein
MSQPPDNPDAPLTDYAERLQAERRAYHDNTAVHDLPEICFYWLMNRYILPQLSTFGFSGADSFFLTNLQRAYHSSGERSSDGRVRPREQHARGYRGA